MQLTVNVYVRVELSLSITVFSIRCGERYKHTCTSTCISNLDSFLHKVLTNELSSV